MISSQRLVPGVRNCISEEFVDVLIEADKKEAGRVSADLGAQAIRQAISDNGKANIILATGASQFEMLQNLVQAEGIDWTKVTCFHLDEYVGLPMTHEASFRRYLHDRFVEQLPQPVAKFHYIDAETDPHAECARLAEEIKDVQIDVAFIGIGENAHLAFNDPPADFETETPYLVVNLDDACRQQQFGEGWFPSFDAVPTQAISMSVKQILKSKKIICTVPDERKAKAVKGAVRGEITPDVPASILQRHEDTKLVLDKPAASLL